MFWFALLVVGGYAVYVLRPDERRRVLAYAAERLSTGVRAVDRHRPRPAPDPFDEAIRTRIRAPFVGAGAVLLNGVVFLLMLVGPGGLDDPATLVAHGGSIGPLTTNGEWWRLVTATFVHAGVLQCAVDVAALAQAALLVERLFGHVTCTGIYLASAALAGAIGLWADPLTVHVGTSAPVFAFYGLLAAHVVRGTLRRSVITISRRGLARLAPVAGLFAVYYFSSGGTAWRAGLAVFVVGFAIGLALTRGVAERTPRPLRVIPLAAVTTSMAMALVTPLQGMTDVRSEVARLFAVEDHIAARYRAATAQFTRGTIKADVLAQLIERSIVPEIEAARRQLRATNGVPPRQQALVADADEYLRLRGESWKLRADALHKSNMRLLRDADERARASAAMLEKLRPAVVEAPGN